MESLTVNGRSVAVQFPTRARQVGGATNWLSKGPSIAFSSLLGDGADAVGYFFSAVSCPDARTVRVVCPTPGATLWMGGIPVRSGDRVSLAQGITPLVAKVVRQSGDEAHFMLQFLESGDLKTEVRHWYESLTISKPIFERIVRYKPDSDLAAKARRCLAHLERGR